MKIIYPLVFIFFLLINLASSGGHTDTADGKFYFLITENLAINHSLKISSNSASIDIIHAGKGYFSSGGTESKSNGTQSEVYIPSSPVLPVTGVPFYFLAKIVHISPTVLVPFFVNSVFLALTATIIFLFGSELYNSKKIGFILSLFAGVCSFSWPYISTYFEQPSAGLMIVSSLYFIILSNKNKLKSSAFFGGIFLGLIALSHIAFIISIPGILVFGLYSFRKEIRKIIQFLSGFLPLLGFLFYLNFIRFHSITNTGYGHWAGISDHSLSDGIYGMIFSPGFGMIVNFPLIVLFPISIYYLWKKEKGLALLFTYIFVSAWLFFGTLQTPIWHGFGGWGPRYMVAILPIITITVGALLKDSHKKVLKIIYAGLASFGFFVNLLGVLVWYQLGYMMGWSLFTTNKVPPSLQIHLLEWSIQYTPWLLHLEVLITHYWDHISPKNLYAYWNNACVPDSFLFCNFGILPIVIMLGTISCIAVLIIKNLSRENAHLLNQ